MKHQLLLISVILFSFMIAKAQDKPRETIVFENKEISFKEHPGLIFRVSEPYLRYEVWDTEHTGTAYCSVALEFENKSDKSISAIYFNVKMYSKDGELAYQGTSGTGPMTFEPKDGNVLKPGYKGIYNAFFNKDKSFYEKYDKLEFTISEVKTASASLVDKPVFSDNWLKFESHQGLEFRLSKPYILLDDLSGNERFAIAMEFKNTSGNPVNRFYFKVKVYDDKGLVSESEKQQHNGLYVPSPVNFMKTEFPDDYVGINKKFYTNEKSFMDKFSKIEIELIKVE